MSVPDVASKKLALLTDRFAACMLRKPQIPHDGLTILGLRAIATIYFRKQPPTMKELAAQLGIKLPSASVLIDKLEHERYVLRTQDEHDKRITRVHITDKSRELIAARRGHATTIIAEAIEQMNSAEQHVVLQFFEQCIAIAERESTRQQ